MSEDELSEGGVQETPATRPAEPEVGPGAADDGAQGQPKPRGATVRRVLWWMGVVLTVGVVLIGVAFVKLAVDNRPDWPPIWGYEDFMSLYGCCLGLPLIGVGVTGLSKLLQSQRRRR
jgi:hypothetical protein